MKKVWKSKEDLLLKPEIETEVFELFFSTYLIGIVFSWVALAFGSLLTSSSILSIIHFLNK